MKAIITVHTEYGEGLYFKNLVEDKYFKEVIPLLKVPDDYEVVERTIIIHFILSCSSYK